MPPLKKKAAKLRAVIILNYLNERSLPKKKELLKSKSSFKTSPKGLQI